MLKRPLVAGFAVLLAFALASCCGPLGVRGSSVVTLPDGKLALSCTTLLCVIPVAMTASDATACTGAAMYEEVHIKTPLALISWRLMPNVRGDRFFHYKFENSPNAVKFTLDPRTAFANPGPDPILDPGYAWRVTSIGGQKSFPWAYNLNVIGHPVAGPDDAEHQVACTFPDPRIMNDY